jgi:polyphenol oxidase
MSIFYTFLPLFAILKAGDENMTLTFYTDTASITSGMTLKDPTQYEANNMALHVCEKPQLILENRRYLAAQLDCTLNDFVCAQQTHSANFHRVESKDRGRGAEHAETAIPDTDALYTYAPNLLLCSFTADCVPVIFYNEKSGLTGVIHSGWQGTVKEITLKLFEHLKNEEDCKMEDLHVQIGAALSQEKFEVDEDVYRKFKKLGYADEFIYYKDQTQKYHIDNQLTVKKQCELAGVPSDQIRLDRTCTFKSEKGFSYRQDRQSGRHLAFILRKEA